MRIACLVLLTVLAGCGAEAVPVADDGERGVREAAVRYAKAVRSGDARALCSQQVAKELRDRLAAMGADCARTSSPRPSRTAVRSTRSPFAPSASTAIARWPR